MPKVIELITAKVQAPLGAPALPTELEINPLNDIYPALIKYYSHIPITVNKQHGLWQSREAIQKISELLPPGNTVVSENSCEKVYRYFYVGVISYAVRQQLGQSRFDEYLLGMNYSIPNFDPERTLLNNTLIDMNVGDVYYEENLVLDQVKWIVGGSCLLSVIYGLGYEDIEKVPLRHLDFISSLVKLTYYQRLLSVRETGEFGSADFKISTDLLRKAYDKAVTDSDDMIQSMGWLAATRG